MTKEKSIHSDNKHDHNSDAMPYFVAAFIIILVMASFKAPWFVSGIFVLFFSLMAMVIERWPDFGNFLENPAGFIAGERDHFKPGLVAFAYVAALWLVSAFVFLIRLVGESFI